MRRPIHLWIVGIISLLWNAVGAYDYLMTQLGNEAYLSMLTDVQRAYMDTIPTWFAAAWATGVWFSVLGSILLLLRSRMAGSAFAISLVGLIVSSLYSYVLANPSATEIMGTFALYFTAAVFVVLILLWIYARAMTRRGVLR